MECSNEIIENASTQATHNEWVDIVYGRQKTARWSYNCECMLNVYLLFEHHQRKSVAKSYK